METFAQTQQKSRLGQILLDKRLVSQEQLSKAMEQQATTGERLGDILTQWNIVTQRHIKSALRAQRTLRMVAYLTTATMTPLLTACGGGGGGTETKPATQSTAAQSTQTAVVAASQIPSESTTPSTPTGWVIRDSVCCATVTTTATTTAVAPVGTATAAPVIAPNIPTNLGAVALSATHINLTWIDNSAVTSKYRIYRDGSATAIAEITGTTYTDYTVSANTSYSYQIRAVDTGNSDNTSEVSTFPLVTTPAGQNANNAQNGNISALSQGLGGREGSCDLSHTTFC